jgi:hypothetical protein
MSAGEVKQYLVEHAESHGVLSFRGNRARRVQTLLPALAPFRCQPVQGGGGGLVHRPNRRTQTACHPKSEPRNFRRSGREGSRYRLRRCGPRLSSRRLRLGLRVAPTLDGVKFEPVAVRFFDVEHFDVDRMSDQIARPFQGAFVRIEFVRSNCGRLDVFVSGP